MDAVEGFDIGRLHSLIAERVAGLARLEAADLRDGTLSVLVIPTDPACDPVRIRVVDDVCHLWFGAGTQQTLGWGNEGDEDHVLDVLDSIIIGNASERAWLGDDGDIRLFGHIRGRHSTVSSGGDVPTIHIRDLPAWK